MTAIAGVAKAIVSGVAAFCASLGAAVASGESFGQIDAKTWLAAVLAAFIAGVATYNVKNKVSPPVLPVPPQPVPVVVVPSTPPAKS
jgi:hypothetical protein